MTKCSHNGKLTVQLPYWNIAKRRPIRVVNRYFKYLHQQRNIRNSYEVDAPLMFIGNEQIKAGKGARCIKMLSA